jgi:hypothetical protein
MLQIDNKDTGEGKDVIIQYADSINSGAAQSPHGYVEDAAAEAVDGTGDFGSALVSDTGSDNQLSYDEVASIYGFEFDDGNVPPGQHRISPRGAFGGGLGNGNEFQEPKIAMSLPQANGSNTPSSAALDFVVRLNDTLGDKIASFVSNEGLDADGGTIRLVDTIFVAETNDTSADTSSDSAVEPATL